MQHNRFTTVLKLYEIWSIYCRVLYSRCQVTYFVNSFFIIIIIIIKISIPYKAALSQLISISLFLEGEGGWELAEQ